MRPEQEPRPRPRIVAVDRDAATRALLADELDDRYGRHYDIIIAASSVEARPHLRDVAQVDVALVLADRADDGARLLADDTIPASARQARVVDRMEREPLGA